VGIAVDKLACDPLPEITDARFKAIAPPDQETALALTESFRIRDSLTSVSDRVPDRQPERRSLKAVELSQRSAEILARDGRRRRRHVLPNRGLQIACLDGPLEAGCESNGRTVDAGKPLDELNHLGYASVEPMRPGDPDDDSRNG